MKHSLSIFCVLLSLSVTGYADQIRGNLVSDTILTFSPGDSGSFSLKLEDIASFRVNPRMSPLVQALEIEVRIPPELEPYMDGFAVLAYGSINPAPAENIHFYRGSQLGYTTLPPRGRIYIRIPVSGNTASSPSPGTIVYDPVKDFHVSPVFITVLPFMKGIPDEVYSLSFPLKVYPVFRELGLIELDIKADSGTVPESILVYIDDNLIESPIVPIALKPGIHTLHIEAPGCRDIIQNIAVEKGSLTRSVIVLEKHIPTVLIEAPQGSTVFLDGSQLRPPFGEAREISGGEHTVVYKIGDYTISRKFQTEPGQSYKIELFLDILIENY